MVLELMVEQICLVVDLPAVELLIENFIQALKLLLRKAGHGGGDDRPVRGRIVEEAGTGI